MLSMSSCLSIDRFFSLRIPSFMEALDIDMLQDYSVKVLWEMLPMPNYLVIGLLRALATVREVVHPASKLM